jgi:hypothetical protein
MVKAGDCKAESQGWMATELEKHLVYYLASFNYANKSFCRVGGIPLGWTYTGRSRSQVGNVGARMNPKFLATLEKSHHGVDLTKDEKHRVHLWLDMNCQWLGSYDPTPEVIAAQEKGEIVWPSWEHSLVDPKNPTRIQGTGVTPVINYSKPASINFTNLVVSTFKNRLSINNFASDKPVKVSVHTLSGRLVYSTKINRVTDRCSIVLPANAINGSRIFVVKIQNSYGEFFSKQLLFAGK